MFVQFQNDTTVLPKESEHFQEMGVDGEVVSFYETDLYKEDWIGLRTLFEQRKVQLRMVYNADHLQFDDEEIINEFIPFLFNGNHRVHNR